MSNYTLPPELQDALDASGGILQGSSFVLMKPEVVLEWFGIDKDGLRRQFQPAIEQIERGELIEVDVSTFLAEMRRKHRG